MKASDSLIDNRVIRVFISSTFRDMQDERDELMKKTFPMLRRKAAERDVTLTELDLRWGITPEESQSGKVVEICFREIENAIPFFVGIIGNRYGWVPSPEDLGESLRERYSRVDSYVERRLSVTEMEMQFGVLERPEVIHAFFFIKEPELTDTDEPEKLAALKASVRSNGRYPVSTYSSPEDLASQVEEAFTRLLDELFPEGELSELEKERLGQRSYLKSLCQNYIRTDSNFATIDEWMKDWERHQLVITGASGLGKSALVANWLKEKLAAEEDLPYTIIYHFVGNGGSIGSHGHVIKALCDEIRGRYGFDGGDNELNADEKALEELFNKVASEGDKPLLIVLDAINQIIDIDNSKQLNWLPIPPKNVKILFTTLEDDRTMEVFKNRSYPVFTLHPLTKLQREEMVNGYLGLYSKKLQPYQVDRIVSDKQCENTLVLKTLLDELVNYGLYEWLDRKIAHYLGTESIDSFYDVLLKSYESDFGEERVRYFLSLIAVSRNGLSESEILTITGDTPLHWSQFFCSFRYHLIVKNGLVSFAHSFIRNAVESRYVNGFVDWERQCRRGITRLMEGGRSHREWFERAFQYDKLEDFDAQYGLLLDLEVFDFFYSNAKLELGTYWKKITAANKDYSPREYIHCQAEKKEKYLNDVTFWAHHVYSDIEVALILSNEALSLAEMNKNTQAIADAYANIGNILFDKGQYREAVLLHEKDLELEKQIHGYYHQEVANAFDNLGRSWMDVGDYQKAEECFKSAVDIFTALDDEERVAIMGTCLGSLFQRKGEYSKAVDCFKQSLCTDIALFGRLNPEVSVCYNNLCNVYICLGRYDDAIEYGHQALEISMGCFGEKDKDVAYAYNNLGCAYHESGQFDNAIDCHEASLRITMALFGEENPSTATSFSNLGVLYDDCGQHEKGFEYARKALDIRVKVLGEDNADTAKSYDVVGAFYAQSQRYQEALDMFEKAKTILVKLNGDDNEDLASVYDNIGNAYLGLSDQKKGIESIKKGLEIRLRLFGEHNKYTIQSLNNYAYAYEEVDLNESIVLYKKALHLQVETYGEVTRQACEVYNNLRYCYRELEDDENGLECALKAYEIDKSLSTPPDPYYAQEAGECFYSMGRYKDAVGFFEEALKGYPPDNEDYYNCLCSLSVSEHHNKNYERAESLSEEMIEWARKSENRSLLARAYRIYGYHFLDRNEDERALRLFEQSFEANPDDERAAETRRVSSVVLRRQGKYEKSLDYCNEAISLFRRVNNEKGVAHCLLSQGLTYKAMKDFAAAKECMEGALCLRRRLFPSGDPQVAECEQYLNEVNAYLSSETR